VKKNEIVVFYGMLFRKYDSKYYCNGAFGRYIDELARRYEFVYLCVPVKNLSEKDYDEYFIRSSNVLIQNIPAFDSYLGAIKNARKIKRAIEIASKKWNSPVILRWPAPFFYFVARICKKRCLPLMLHLVADTTKVVNEGTKYKGLYKILALNWAKYLDFKMAQLLVEYPALINGVDLRRLYDYNDSKNREIRTSTIFRNEISDRINNFDRNAIKILYVGYFRHEKGLQFLFKAISELKVKGYNPHLTLVGSGPLKGNLEDLARKLDIASSVDFLGHIPMGTKLFNEYRRHNVFVLPSISEGTPRVLIESMACGLVTIATDAGGSSFTIEDGCNGLLIPPKDPQSLVDAIAAIVDDPSLQKRLIQNGYKFAYDNSIEGHVDEVVNHVKDFCFPRDRELINESLKEQVVRIISKNTVMKIANIFLGLLPNTMITQRIRGWVLKPFFATSGVNLRIADNVTFIHPEKLHMGDNVYIANNSWINSSSNVFLEDGVIIAPYVVIATTKHRRVNNRYLNHDPSVGDLRVGKGVWICSHSVIAKSIMISDGALIGANSVVTKDVDENAFVSGIPAIKVRELGPDED